MSLRAPLLVLQNASEVPTGSWWLSPSEAARAAALRVAWRRRSWLLGRWTAKRAILAWLGLAADRARLEALEIQADANGAPEPWLGGALLPVALSLSHRGDTALGCVGRAEIPVGCDVELIEERSPGFVDDFFTAGEQRLVADAPAAARALLVTLVWSAKESALKALRTGLTVDTRAVEVTLGAAAPGEWSPVTVEAAAWQRAFPGWWRSSGSLVLCMVSGESTVEPEMA